MADLALVVNEEDTSLHMLVAGNISKKPCVLLHGGVMQPRARKEPSGCPQDGPPARWAALPHPGDRCDHQFDCVQVKPAFPICNTVCSTGVGKRPVVESTAEPNTGLHFPRKSFQLT